MTCISYKKGYKYQLVEEYTVLIPLIPKKAIETEYICLSLDGELWIKKGYAWDGPSGPTFDTLNFMRGSLVHDTLYQLMRNKELDGEYFKDPADRLLQRMGLEDGMSWLRSQWVYLGLKYMGKAATLFENKKVTITAPEGCELP